MREQEYDRRGQNNHQGQGRGQDNRRGQGQGQGQGNVQEFDPSQYGFPERPVADVALVAEVIEDAVAQGLNVLAPVTRLQYLPPGYQVAIRLVHFTMGGEWKGPQNGKRSNGTWYTVDGGGVALLKAPLRQLLAAAGGSVETVRMDDRRSGAFWEFQARVKIRTMDGSWRTITATKDLDLRDNSPVVESWVKNANGQEGGASKRILQARENGGRMSEAKAVNAAIRDALGLKASYTREEAGRPFMFPLLVYTPTSAEALQMQAAVELGVVAQVYGPSAPGRAYAPAGSIIDLDATEGQRPALVDRGQHSGPDAEAELRRRGERQTIQRGPPPRQEDEGSWADEDIPFDDHEEEREPPRQAGRQSGRQGPATAQGGGGGGGDQGVCSERGCGRAVSRQVTDYSMRTFGQVLCMDHQPRPTGSKQSSGR